MTTHDQQTVSVAEPDAHLKCMAARAYAKQQQAPAEDKRITDFLPMVHKIVSQVTSYLKPPLSREDLVSAGTIGLIKAAHDYDATKNAEFKTYAYIRVRGAVIDELRSWSFAPPSLNKQLQQAEQAYDESVKNTGAAPTDEEIAAKMGITTGKLYRTYENARARHFLSISGYNDDEPALANLLVSKNTNSPDGNMAQAELAEQLVEAIQSLPEKQRQIIILYYQQELTMKEIAEVLEITESRVSQLHSGALFKMSSNLREYDDTR